VYRSSEIIPEDGSSMFLRNVRIYVQDYTVLTACLISDPVLLLQVRAFHGLFSFAFESAKLQERFHIMISYPHTSRQAAGAVCSIATIVGTTAMRHLY
jgi:hypothetical protein